jgi:hypothetical protein
MDDDPSEKVTVSCETCKAVLLEDPSKPSPGPCPQCGGVTRHVLLEFHDEIGIREKLVMKLKDPSLTGKAKVRQEQIVGDDLHKKSGRWLTKNRLIDRTENRYFEEVIDPATGEVVHRTDEPLDRHVGHGSDKAREDTDKSPPEADAANVAASPTKPKDPSGGAL